MIRIRVLEHCDFRIFPILVDYSCPQFNPLVIFAWFESQDLIYMLLGSAEE